MRAPLSSPKLEKEPARRRWSRALVRGTCTVAFVGALGAPLAAQSIGALREIESRLLDRRLENYDEAHRREQSASVKLRQLRQQLHTAIGNREIAVEQLRRMEAGLSLAREAAVLRTKETADLRRDIYDRMEYLAELDKELSKSGGILSGVWTIDLGEQLGRGTVSLSSRGTEVEGIYNLSNGARGTLHGTVAAGRVDLRRIDSEAGLDLRLTGQISADRRQIQGQWQTFELASGQRTNGGWSARRRD